MSRRNPIWIVVAVAIALLALTTFTFLSFAVQEGSREYYSDAVPE